MTLVILLSWGVVDKFLILFIEGKVGQVPRKQVFGQRAIILVDSEPRQPLIVDVDAPGIHARDCHIDPQIKLEPIYQEGIRYVLAYDALLIDRNLWYFTDLQTNR